MQQIWPPIARVGAVVLLALACTLALVIAFPVRAAVIAEAAAGDVKVELHDVAGPCLAPARLAVFTRGQVRIPGCWKGSPAGVMVNWLDGDRDDIPLPAFKEPTRL